VISIKNDLWISANRQGTNDAEVSGGHAMSELLYRASVVTLWLCPIAIAVIVLFM
jgi:hypothetical protein